MSSIAGDAFADRRPSGAYEAVLATLRDAENDAIHYGKWPMFAYNAEMVDRLETAVAAHIDGNAYLDGAIVDAMNCLIADAWTPESPVKRDDRWRVACRMAAAVYARQVLRACGYTVPHPTEQMRWFREQRRWGDEGMSE